MRNYLIAFVLLLLVLGCSPRQAATPAQLALPAQTSQVLLVTTADWQATQGSLQRWQKVNGEWQTVGEPMAVQVGRNGLAWGVGLHRDGAGGQKVEGDGKAPAGVFALGTAFGYATQPPQGLRMPYRVATERDYWVDAVDSPDYNHWRALAEPLANEPQQHWASFERMRRADQQYELGMVIEHNTQPVIAGRGSAIFLHVWLDPHTPTSGCTAMSKENLLAVLAWLQPEAQPLLVQVPLPELPRLHLAQAR